MKKILALVLAVMLVMTCSLALADRLDDILAAGTVKAAETTNETLAQVRKAMRIDYFTDRSIVKEWETLLRKANQ